MGIRPLGKNIQIKVKRRDKTKSGLYVANEGSLIYEYAEVLEVGDQVSKVEKGQTVLFKSWAIDEVELEDQKVQFINEDQILGYEAST
jgi:co-chaperonin GroES (HSP10)